MLIADRPLAPVAIRTDLGAIFVSMELSKSTWLVTSLSPGAGERMSRHTIRAGDVAGLFERFAQLRTKAKKRAGQDFAIIVIQEAGLDGFWIHRVLQEEGIESHVVDPRRSRRHVADGAPRPTRSTARRWCAHCWPKSEASRASARWSAHQVSLRRTSAA